MPTTDDELGDVQARLYGWQPSWEIAKAIAMILLAAAAISASASFTDYIHLPQPAFLVFPPGTVITIPPAKT
jgi:hypothetical protein